MSFKDEITMKFYRPSAIIVYHKALRAQLVLHILTRFRNDSWQNDTKAFSARKCYIL